MSICLFAAWAILDLRICGIIQDVFQGDYTTKQKFEIFLENKIIIFQGGGAGVPLHGKFHGNN